MVTSIEWSHWFHFSVLIIAYTFNRPILKNFLVTFLEMLVFKHSGWRIFTQIWIGVLKIKHMEFCLPSLYILCNNTSFPLSTSLLYLPVEDPQYLKTRKINCENFRINKWFIGPDFRKLLLYMKDYLKTKLSQSN